MKPNWKAAPEWANFLAMDDNEEWYWYEFEPWFDEYDGQWNGRDRLERVKDTPQAQFSLEARPNE